MTIARSVARAVASPVARAVAGGGDGVSYDADAAAYFAAVEGAGGSFDLTAIDSAYTAAYVKAAHNTLFAQLKSNGLWSKITEMYLLVGKTFDGITIKAKGSGLITSVNFVSGDYLAAGSGAGLYSNGAKQLDTGLHVNSDSGIGLFVYLTEYGVSTNFAIMGADSGFPNDVIDISGNYSLTEFYVRVNAFAQVAIPKSLGLILGHRDNLSLLQVWLNGLKEGQLTTSVTRVAPSNDISIFARKASASADGRLAIAGVTSGQWNDTDAADLTDAVETFMDALGAGVIA